VLIVLKFGSLNLLEPSGPVKACNGIALSFTPFYRTGIILGMCLLIQSDVTDGTHGFLKPLLSLGEYK
jgi:hypothetical protein